MKKLLLSLTFLSSALADSNFNLILDPFLSPYVGADDMIAAHEMLDNSKFGELSRTYLSKQSMWGKVGRYTELIGFWDPLNYMSMVAQHEVFGHGYRIRSLMDPQSHVTHYHFGLPPPYGVGGGATHFNLNSEKTTVFDFLTIHTGGMEATAIFANRTRLQWLSKGQVNPKQSSLYLFSQHDLTRYVLVTRALSGGDVGEYRHLLNGIFPEHPLPISTLHKGALLNLLDPFTYYSIYAWFHYGEKGKSSRLPMIPIGSYGYLPSFRTGLTPMGPEYYLENYLVKESNPFYFYLRGGKFSEMTFTGLGFECPDLLKIGSIPIGLRADLWLQPNIDFQNLEYSFENCKRRRGITISPTHQRMGASVSLIAQQEIWDHGAFFIQLGGKSKGFIPGETLGAGAIVRVGLTLW